MRFTRVQFTPDLMPSDVTGSSIWNQRDGDFEFRPGPIFANLLLADEINRAPPKTQAALLEAMQERQVTIDGDDARARAVRSSSSRRRTRSSTRARIRCPRRSSTGSCCGRDRLPGARRRESRCSAAASSAQERRGRAHARRRPRDAPRDAARDRGACTSPRASRATVVDLVAATRDVAAASRSARARAGASRSSSSRAPRPRSPVATSSLPDDVKAVAVAGARPPARAPAGALGAADLRPRTSCARCSTTVPTPTAEDVAPQPRDAARGRRPRLDGYASLAASGLVAALALAPAGARRPRRAVRARCSPLGLRAAAAPTLEASFALDRRARARGRGGRRASIVARSRRRDRPPRAPARRSRRASRSSTGRRRRASASRAGEERELGSGSAARAGGSTTSATLALRGREIPRPRRAGSSAIEARAAEGLSRGRSGSGRSSRPRDTQVFTGQRGRARPRATASSTPTSRPFVPGDRAALGSTGAPRRAAGTLVVNERHPERNTDVVLFLDSFADARRERPEHARRRRPRRRDARRRATSSAATASGSSRSAASCAGSQPAMGSRSATGSSTRCSRPASSPATPGGT